jgi:DNA-binding response OmpR family regulator
MRVLVIEDDEGLADVLERGLADAGHEALVSCGPSERASDAGALPASAGNKEDDR